MYDCHTVGNTFSPIGILTYKYDTLPKYGSIPQYFIAKMAQLVEQQTILQQVPGSIPAPNSTWLGVDSAHHAILDR